MAIWAIKGRRKLSWSAVLLGCCLTPAVAFSLQTQSETPLPPPLPPAGADAPQKQDLPSLPAPTQKKTPSLLPQLPDGKEPLIPAKEDLQTEKSNQQEKPLPYPPVPPPTGLNPAKQASPKTKTGVHPVYTDLPSSLPPESTPTTQKQRSSTFPGINANSVGRTRSPELSEEILEKLRRRPPPAFRPIGTIGKQGQPKQPKVAPTPNSPGIGKPSPQRGFPGQSSPAIRIQKTGPATGRIGQTLEFRIVVQNPGRLRIQNLQIEDEIPTAAEVVDTFPVGVVTKERIVWEVDELPAGAKRSFVVRLRPLEPGDLVTKTGACIRVTSSFATKIEGLPLALRIDGPKAIPSGEKGLFKIRIHNKSSQPLAGLTLTARLPEGLFHEASKNDLNRDISATLPVLKPGEDKLIDLDLTAKKAGRFALRVEISTAKGDKRLAEHQVTIRESPRLVLKKIGVQQLQPGVETKYRLEVINEGNVDVENVVVVDHLPTGLEFIAASDKGKFDGNTQTVQWIVNRIAAGHTKAVELKIRGTRPGRYMNQAIAETIDGDRVDLQAELLVGQPAGPLPPTTPILPDIPPSPGP